MIKEYFSSILSAFFAAGLFGVLIPEKSVTAKCVRYLIALSVVVCIVLPLRPALVFLMDICDYDTVEGIEAELEKYTDKTNEMIVEQNREIICDAIKNELKKELDIPLHECEVTFETKVNSGEIIISKVNVFLSGYSMWKSPAQIKEVVHSLTGAECEVIAG